MSRSVFFSFHYDVDNWRAAQVRNMGMVEGNTPVSDNDWESVKKGGDRAIENWIAGQLKYRDCTVVLVGESTSSRKWVIHEIRESWNKNKGVLGVRIHRLKNRLGQQASIGSNPFDVVRFEGTGLALSSKVKLYDPPYTGSTEVYDYIKRNISEWVEEAVRIRKQS